MPSIASFEIDLASTFHSAGPLVAAVEVLRTCLGWDGPAIESAPQLLSELQKPTAQALVGWNQDVVLSAPQTLTDELRLIASENQSCWLAAQNLSGAVELGNLGRGGWQSWGQIELDDLLLRLLVTEAVLGHGPCLSDLELPRALVKPFELLPPVRLAQGPAELMAVVATDRWFGVTSGVEELRFLYASPIDRARSHLERLAPATDWSILR